MRAELLNLTRSLRTWSICAIYKICRRIKKSINSQVQLDLFLSPNNFATPFYKLHWSTKSVDWTIRPATLFSGYRLDRLFPFYQLSFFSIHQFFCSSDQCAQTYWIFSVDNLRLQDVVPFCRGHGDHDAAGDGPCAGDGLLLEGGHWEVVQHSSRQTGQCICLQGF